MPVQVNATGAGGNSVVNAVDNLNLSAYPQLAQMIAAMNMQGYDTTIQQLLSQLQEAEAATIVSTVNTGYGNAHSTLLTGVMQAGVGAGGTLAAGVQLTETVGNFSTYSTEETRIKNQIADIDGQLKSQQNSMVVTNPNNAVNDLNAAGTNIQATEVGAPTTNTQTLPKEELERQRATLEQDHKSNGAKFKANNTKANSRYQMLQTATQLLQLPEQGAQSAGQAYNTQNQVTQTAYSSQNQAAQSSTQALNQVLQFDAYAQNVASSRA